MRKHIFTLMALAATLCACNKEQMSESEITGPVVEPSAPLVFTATMEGAPESKATFDNVAKCASWEVGDQICLNGFDYAAISAGTSTTFVEDNELRPVYVGSTNTHWHDVNRPSNLVDEDGTATIWCAKKSDRVNGIWNIIVSTEKPTFLKSIKLWNADNQDYPDRRWKEFSVNGKPSLDEGWRSLGNFYDLNLAINNRGFAGEIEVNATKAYTFYEINVLDNEGDDFMQMSDMKFVVDGSSIASPYQAYFPSNLYDGTTASLPSVVNEVWADGKFNMPMCAKSSTTNLEFKNLCAVLKITVKSSQMSSVKGIKVSSANKATSGVFTVNSDNAAVLANPSAISNTVTVLYKNAVPTTAEGTVFYVAIPAQTYRNLRIELSADGTSFTKRMTTKTNVDINVARSVVYPINYVAESDPSTNPGNDPLQEEDWGNGGFTQK